MGSSVLEPFRNPPHFLRRSKDQQYISRLLHQNPRCKLYQLKQIQAQLYRRLIHQDNILITKLISICSASGIMDYATRLFDSIREPDLVLCNSMLRGYTRNNLCGQALIFYIQMLTMGFFPDQFTFPCVFKACASLSDVRFGQQVHAHFTKRSGICEDVFVLNSIVDMYFKCRGNEFAMRVFRKIAEPNSTSWNIIVSGLSNCGDLKSARRLFDEMPERDVVSWNTLMSAYGKAGELEVARELFEKMPEKDLVSWNVLIAGYSQSGQTEEALSVFSQMLKSGVEPDNTTVLTVVSAVAGACSLNCDEVDRIVDFARLANSVSVSTAVLDLYSKFGRIEDARKVFDDIPEKDVVTWNAMIGGYSRNQKPLEAIKLFRQMQSECDVKVKPDGLTMVSLIASCSQMGALGLGEWVHAYIEKNEIEMDVFLVTALMDMYAKCGDLIRARLLFEEMPQRDLASWNAIIKGLAIHGQGKEALEIFSVMEKSGVVPNDITFVGLLSACSHGGLLGEGLELFNLMQNGYGIVPRIEHYGCVVDLLGRAGRVAEAYEFVKSMPMKPDSVIWGALLGACRSHQDVKLAEEAACQLVELDPNHDGNYVLLSNVYAAVGKWEDVTKVRAQMRAREVRKTPGCSAVELEGVIYEFTAGDRSNARSEEIYAFWNELIKRIKPMGYEPDTRALLRNLDEEDKEEALFRHSEKLALSFMLINSNDRSPIKIVKNLRICGDCHRTMELVSKLEEREIIVRDRNRFHHFNGGSCSCGGYW